MKSIKFLAALAIPAMFAACTNEDILADMPQNNQELTGAELIGSGISINVGKGDVKSRLSAAAWETGDRLGLAWIGTTKSKSSTIDANNMFVKPEGAAFTTMGNVYKGFHFAYWPFVYMDGNKAGMSVEVNPAQTEAWSVETGDRFDNAFYVSAYQYLTKDDLDEDYQLLNNKDFDMVRVVNEFVVVAEPSTGFAENTLLNNLKIKSVQLSTDQDVFSSYGKMVLNSLPFAQYQGEKAPADIYDNNGIEVKNAVYSREATEAVVKAASKTFLEAYKKDKKHAMTGEKGWDDNVYTDVEGANLVTANTNYLRLFTLPAKGASALTTAGTKIIITTDKGTFTIGYTKNAAEGSDEAYNNAAIEAIVAAYSAEGYTRPSDNKVVKMYELSNLPIGLNVRLLEKNFKPSYSISTYADWKEAVEFINALGNGITTAQTFALKADIEVDETEISMPTNVGIKATGKNIILKKSVSSWPENLNVTAVNVVVDEKANFTIADGSKFNAKSLIVNEGGKLTMKAGKADAENVLDQTITNNGTIIVNKYSEIKTVTNNTRVEIKYGGKVTTDAAVGTIFYTITANENVERYNNLINQGKVNTFVVKSGLTFDYATNSGNISTDEYGVSSGSAAEIDETALAGIKFELNGGNIIGKQLLDDGTTPVSVKAIEVLGGENTISDVVVTDAIDVVKGSLAIDGTDVEMTADVDVAAGAELVSNVNVHVDALTNHGTVTGNADKFHCNSIANNGTLTNVNECDCVYNQEDRDEMQQLVEAIQAKDPNVVDEAALADYINKNVKTQDDYNDHLEEWLVCKILTLMKDYEISFTFGSVTANDIKLFEVAIGVDIEF